MGGLSAAKVELSSQNNSLTAIIVKHSESFNIWKITGSSTASLVQVWNAGPALMIDDLAMIDNIRRDPTPVQLLTPSFDPSSPALRRAMEEGSKVSEEGNPGAEEGV